MSGFTLPGEYLLDLLSKHSDKTLPNAPQNLADLTAEQITFAQVFAAEVNFFLGTLKNFFKTDQKEFSADNLLPAVISCLYLSISQHSTCAEEQLSILEEHKKTLAAYWAAYTVIQENTDCPLSKTLKKDPAEGLFCLMNCFSAVSFLHDQIAKAQKDNVSFELSEEERNMQSSDEKNRDFLDALKSHQAEFKAEATLKKTKLLGKLDKLIINTTKIMNFLNPTQKKDSNKLRTDKLCLSEASLHNTCNDYRAALEAISAAITEYSEKDPIKLQGFLYLQYHRIQNATDRLATSRSIETLNKTKNNWLVQKLSDLVRSAYKLIDRRLPNWSWLYHPVNNQLHQTIQTAKNPQLLLDFEQKTRTDSVSELPCTHETGQRNLRTSRL